MTQYDLITAHEIQDYIDERLDRQARADFIARLLACPKLGAEVEVMRRQQDALRQLGQEALYEPVPPRLLRILERASTERPRDGGSGSGRRPNGYRLAAVVATLVLGWVARSPGF